ncbi:MAG: UvrD-helicase domain-containing protein [Polyangiaceae bacterium]
MSSPPALNAPQAEAVAHIDGPLLVFAGAGSGKTRVITYRVANLVAERRVAPYRILAVTFTNKAAQEMRTRLQKIFVEALGEEVGEGLAKDLWVGTFHATCAKLLRRYGQSIGLPRDFVIYDTQDQKAVVTRALRELDYDEKRYPPRAVLGRIHKEKQEGRGPDDMSADDYFDEALVKIFAKYEDHLKRAGAVDFEDLIGRTVKLMEDPKNPDAETIRRRFDYVLVDEFQDTNRMQYRLIRSLAQDHHNLCVVGDDDQSIYRWRGADVRNIRGFKKDFPEARVVKLEQNYRSTARIVRAALGVIAPSRDREPKELWTDNEDGAAIEIVAARDEHDEAAFVTRFVTEGREQGTSLREMAVFYRIHAQSRVLEEALRIANVPYQIVGGTKFYERAEVKDALAYLRVLVNPRSDVDFLRIVNVPARGIGSTTIERMMTFAQARGTQLHDILDLLDEAEDVPNAAKKKLAGLRDLLEDFREFEKDHAPSEVLDRVLEKTGYREALKGDDSAEADARLENLAELIGSIRDYEAEMQAAGEKPSLSGFLERVSLHSDIDQMSDEGRVTLMTVHGAKGLEFERVVITGMEEEMFPYRGMEPGGEEELEEERRLAYVAITRARKHLALTHTSMRQIFGTTRWGRPSRFLSNFPADAVVQKATRQASSRPQERYVDRASASREYAPMPAWKQAPAPSRPPQDQNRAPGERYVDREYFSDTSGDSDGGELRKGSRVLHTRFGEGEVRRVEAAGEPAAVVFFPGWGEKKVLARFLRLT